MLDTPRKTSGLKLSSKSKTEPKNEPSKEASQSLGPCASKAMLDVRPDDPLEGLGFPDWCFLSLAGQTVQCEVRMSQPER